MGTSTNRNATGAEGSEEVVLSPPSPSAWSLTSLLFVPLG